MKKIMIVSGLILLAGLMSTAVFAVGSAPVDATAQVQHPLVDANGQPIVATDTAGQVPQAQIERMKKRDEMNKRRAEMLKVRQQLIETDSPGNVDGQQPIK